MDINGSRSEKEEMDQQHFLQKSLEKQRPCNSQTVFDTVTGFSDSEEHPNCQKLILRVSPCFQDPPTLSWLGLLLLYKHTHITPLTKSLQKHLPAFCYKTEDIPSKVSDSGAPQSCRAPKFQFTFQVNLFLS